jgi:hypothetical protein
MITDPYRSPGGMIKGKFDNLFFHFGRSFVWEGLWDRWPIHQALEALFLEGPLVLVEPAPGNTVTTAGFGYVSEFFSKL